MRFVWVVVFLFLLVPTLSTALTNTEYNRANFFTASESNSVMTIPIAPAGQQFRKVTVEYDLEIPNINSNPWSGHPSYEYMVADLKALTGTGGWTRFLMGLDVRKSQGGWVTYFDAYGNPGPDTTGAQWGNGRYHVVMVLDGDAAQARVTITKDGQSFSSMTTGDLTVGHVTSGLTFDADELSRGLAVVLGVDENNEYHRIPVGFRYSNLRVEAVEGVPSVGGGAPPEILAQDAGPYIASSGVTKTLTAPAAGTYTIEVDVTPSQNRWRTDITPGTDDHGQPWAIVYPLIGVEGHAYGNNPSSGCVKNCLAYLNAFNSQGSKALYIYRSALGGNDGFEERHQPFEWVPGTRYHLTVLIDSVNQKQTMTITGGGEFSKTEDLPSEISTAVSQGITVFFGGDKDWDGERVARPNGWKFENMKITGGSGSDGGCTDCQCIDLGAVEYSAPIGPLKKLASNPIFFDDGTGKAVYLAGSHTWQNFQDYGTTADFNYDAYLDMMEANNHNFMRLWVWEQPSNEDDGTRWEPMPWQKNAQGKYDLDQFNQAYFDRLLERVQQAKDRGIYVQVMLFQYYIDTRDHPLIAGNNINGVSADVISNNNGDNVHHMGIGQGALQAQERYVRKTIDTLNGMDNVLWEVCNECPAATTAWQTHMVDVIHDYEATKPKRHLVGVNTGFGGGGENFNGLKATGADIVAIPLKDGSHYDPPQSDGSVIVISDTDHIQSILFSTSASTRVDWAWKSLTRGLHPTNMDTIQVAFPSDWCQESPSCRADSGAHKAARRAMGQTLAFADRADLATLRPQRTRCSTQYCLLSPSGGIVYAPEGGTFTVDLTGVSGTLEAQWMNPMTGEVRAGETVQGGASRSFTTPFTGMAALSLTAQTADVPTSTAACSLGSGTGSGSGSGSNDGGASGSLQWLPNIVNGLGFSPETSDPASTTLLDDAAFSFTSGGVREVIVPSSLGPLERFSIMFDVTIPTTQPPASFRQVLDVRCNCSGKQLLSLWLRPEPGQAVLDARGAPKLLTGDITLPTGSYRVEVVFDLADSESYTTIKRSDGTVVGTIGGSLNADAANVVRASQLAGGLKLRFGSETSDTNQLLTPTTGWVFSGLTVTATPAGEESGDTGPDGADLETNDGRLAFLAGTLADAAREEGGDWTLDCGPAGEVLPLAPSDAPNDAGERYCALSIDGDIVFGTFGVADGDTTAEQQVLTSLQDAAYRLHVPEGDIDSSACNSIDTTTQEFQECDDAIDGMRTYALVDPLTSTSFIIISDSGIDAFSTNILESIGAFFRDLFGIDDDDTSLSIPSRRFHHAFFADREGRSIAATWVDRDATLFYRGFVTDLSAWTPIDAQYAMGLGGQAFIAELDEDRPSDVRTWRQLTSALRITDASGDVIGGAVCGNGVVDLGETCESGSPARTCGEFSGEETNANPVPCGAPGSEHACRLDIASCGLSSACGDDWTPVARPLPCGAPRVREDGDDALCPQPGGGGGGGGGGDDGGGNGGGDDEEPPAVQCEEATVTEFTTRYPASGCPSGYTAIGVQNSIAYCRKETTIQYAAGTQSVTAIDVRAGPCGMGSTNYGSSGSLAFCGSSQELSYAAGGNGLAILKELVITDSGDVSCPTGYIKTSWNGGTHTLFCTKWETIWYASCEAAEPGGSGSGDGDACLPFGETCEEASDCCSKNCRDNGLLTQCAVRIGRPGTDPELI